MSDHSVERRLSNPTAEAIRRHPAVRAFLVILPAVVSSIAAYTGAGGQSDHVEDKAEAGYHVTLKHVEDLRTSIRALQARLVQTEADLEAIRRSVRAAGRPLRSTSSPAPARPAPVAVQAAPPPPALPRNLDQALEQVQAQPAAPAVPPVTEPPKP